MSKKYPLSITKEYCSDWTVENAVRELLQNMLDSPTEGRHEFSGDTLTITSLGITLPPSTLLMGCTTKRGDEDSVGGKGEGFKLALGILLREGLDVKIYNGALLWEPFFEFDPLYNEEILVIYETIHNLGGNDLTFEVEGLTEENKENIIDECLYLRDDISDVVECANGNIIKDFGGKVYVGGLFVCNNERLHFSYDFKPNLLPLNRDRKSVDDWNLRDQTSAILQQGLEIDLLVDLVSKGAYDTNNLKYSYSTALRDACAKKFLEENEGCIVADCESDKEGLEHAYSGKATIPNSEVFRSLVKESSTYVDHLSRIKKVEDTRRLDLIKAFEEAKSDLEDDLGVEIEYTVEGTCKRCGEGVIIDCDLDEIDPEMIYCGGRHCLP